MKYKGLAVAGVAAVGLLLLASSASASEDSSGGDRSAPPKPPAPEPPPKETTEDDGDRPTGLDLLGEPIAQKTIVDAVWASVTKGDPTPLATVARQLSALPPPVRAYVLAASREGPKVYKETQQWIKAFTADQKEKAAQRDKEIGEAETAAKVTTTAIAAVAAAAASANAVPVVGQVVSAVLALGLAIAVALTEKYKLPERRAEDQIRSGYEGVTVFFGLGIDPDPNPNVDTRYVLRRRVVLDEVAFALPSVPQRAEFPFAPSYLAFKEAAEELRLYQGNT